MLKVVIESPYAAPKGVPEDDVRLAIELNVRYARNAMRHCLDRGEAPYASHLLYTQVYDDGDPVLRQRGIQAGYEWMIDADVVAFYVDRGWSPGMLKALAMARMLDKTCEARSLYSKELQKVPNVTRPTV